MSTFTRDLVVFGATASFALFLVSAGCNKSAPVGGDAAVPKSQRRPPRRRRRRNRPRPWRMRPRGGRRRLNPGGPGGHASRPCEAVGRRSRVGREAKDVSGHRRTARIDGAPGQGVAQRPNGFPVLCRL